MQLLWDLELLTGAGLGLFWPPRAQVYGLREQAQEVWSQHSKTRGRMRRGPEPLASRVSRGTAEGKGGQCDIRVIVVGREEDGVWALDTYGPGLGLCFDAPGGQEACFLSCKMGKTVDLTRKEHQGAHPWKGYSTVPGAQDLFITYRLLLPCRS